MISLLVICPTAFWQVANLYLGSSPSPMMPTPTPMTSMTTPTPTPMSFPETPVPFASSPRASESPDLNPAIAQPR